jgi:hypothetical protein
MFGLGADGRLLPRQTPQGFQRASVFTRMTKGLIDGVTKIFQPIKAAGQIVGKSLGGAFGGILRTIGSLGGFAKLFGTILKPIGIVFSLFDGVKTFMNTEGNLFEKINAGIAAALGDFVGAPLDLLKSGLSWVAKTLLGEDNFISKFLDSFKIEKVLKDIIATPGKILMAGFNYLKKIFDPDANPAERFAALVEPFEFILDTFKRFFDNIKNFFGDKIKQVASILGFDMRSEEEKEIERLQTALQENEKIIAEKQKEKAEQMKVLLEKQKALEEKLELKAKKEAEILERKGELSKYNKKALGKIGKDERIELSLVKSAIDELDTVILEKTNELNEAIEKLNKSKLSGAPGQTPSGNGAADVLAFQNAARQSVLSATAPPVFQTNDNSVSSTQIENKYTGGDRILPVSGYGLYTQAI